MFARSYNDILRKFSEEIFPYERDFQIEVLQAKDALFIKCLSDITNHIYQTPYDAYSDFVKKISLELFSNKGVFEKKTSEKFPFKIRFPKALGGKKTLRQMKCLKDPEYYMSFPLMNIKNGFSYKDLKQVVRIQNINVNRRLKLLGDCFSMSSNKYKTQFYLIYREIKLQKAKAIMRSHIYYALSEYIRKNNLGIYFILKDLYDPTDYDQILREFIERKIGGVETLKKVM